MFTIKIVIRIQNSTTVMSIIGQQLYLGSHKSCRSHNNCGSHNNWVFHNSWWAYIQWYTIQVSTQFGGVHHFAKSIAQWHTQMERETVVIKVKSPMRSWSIFWPQSPDMREPPMGKLLYITCSIADHDHPRMNVVWRSWLPLHSDYETSCFKSLSRSKPL